MKWLIWATIYGLITRSKSGISLTNYGETLQPYINAVLSSEESLNQAVFNLNGLQQGLVKIGCFSSVCTNWMPDIISMFHMLSIYTEMFITHILLLFILMVRNV